MLIPDALERSQQLRQEWKEKTTASSQTLVRLPLSEIVILGSSLINIQRAISDSRYNQSIKLLGYEGGLIGRKGRDLVFMDYSQDLRDEDLFDRLRIEEVETRSALCFGKSRDSDLNYSSWVEVGKQVVLGVNVDLRGQRVPKMYSNAELLALGDDMLSWNDRYLNQLSPRSKR
jgi:hypothetical protein